MRQVDVGLRQSSHCLGEVDVDLGALETDL
jgi:hypothetical protein